MADASGDDEASCSGTPCHGRSVAAATDATALAYAVVAALLAVPAFWTGLPFVLGVAAVILGNVGRTAQGTEPGRAIAAVVLGALGVAVSTC